MAISPKDTYPGQVDISDLAGWPHGRARNITVPGDGTGTPLEEQWLSDLFGFQQTLLAFAGITPSGVPDKVGASQYMDALSLVIEQHGFTNLSAIDVSVSNDLSVGGTALIQSGATLQVDAGGTLQCVGSAFFEGVVDFNFPLTLDVSFTANELATFNEKAIFNDPGGGLNALEATGTALFSAQVTTTGLLVAGGGIIVGAPGLINSGPTQLVGAVELDSPMTLQGGGRIRERIVVGADANSSYGPATVDFVRVDTLTAARDYTINDTGAADGDSIEFANFNATHNLVIKTPLGATIIALRQTGGGNVAVRCVRIAGSWLAAYYWTA